MDRKGVAIMHKEEKKMENILTLSHISKIFGNHQVLSDLNFSVPEHTIFGFIGQNGAGKTTTMKMILGLLKPDEGEIFVCKEKVEYGQNRTNKYIGYLPDVPEFYGFMTSKEYLTLCGQITGMAKEQYKERILELLELVGLTDNRKQIQGFSRGMKQRLGIAQALLNRPKLLICDEPTSALDPLGRKEILDILSSIKKETTVIFSTHILSDVERICDKIACLHDGKIALQNTMQEMHFLYKDTEIEIEFDQLEDMELFQKSYPNGIQTGRLQLHYKKYTKEDMKAMLLFLGKNNITIQKIERLEPTLEELFMEVVKK